MSALTAKSCLLLFGATGDLARRMLLPSLFALHADGLLPAEFRIVATARGDMDDEKYRAFAAAALNSYSPTASDKHRVGAFLDTISFISVDASKPEAFSSLTEAVGKANASIFLSTAPSLFEATISGLKAAGLVGPNVKIGLEKPLGTDLATSRNINDAVLSVFPEGRTFRIDHYLGKETVQNLIALRFGNTMFEPLWSAGGIDHVQITVAETVGLEGRIDFYDGAGALRDMVQNHMLQLLALVAMEPPGQYGAGSVRDEKVKVLRALRPIDRATITSCCVRGQYGAGALQGQAVAGYSDELGRKSDTETFVALKAHVDNWRWKGVPFYLRTGKRLPCRQSEILIQFKSVPHSIFPGSNSLPANKLLIRLQPEEYIRLLVMAKQPGLDRGGVSLREVPLDLSLSNAFADTRRRIAYERLLLDLIEGDPTLFVRRDEVEAQWSWIDTIRAGWDANSSPVRSYAAGTWGPAAAIALTERNGVSWHD